MASVLDELISLQAGQADLVSCKEALEMEDERLRDLRAKLSSRIQNGASTGDAVTDLAVVLELDTPTERLARLSALVAQLKGAAGQFLITIHRHERYDGICTGMGYVPTDNDLSLVTDVSIGVVFDEGPIPDVLHSRLQVGRTEVKFPRYSNKCSPVSQPMTIGYELALLSEPMVFRNSMNDPNFWSSSRNPRPVAQFEVIAGDEAVLDWFLAQNRQGWSPADLRERLASAAELLKRELPPQYQELMTDRTQTFS